MATKDKLNVLYQRLEIVKAEANLKYIEMEQIKKEIAEIEWVLWTWDDLEQWLKENRPVDDRGKYPTVRDTDGRKSYCKLSDKREMIIGGYYHNDHFPRGEDVYVHHEFEPFF